MNTHPLFLAHATAAGAFGSFDDLDQTAPDTLTALRKYRDMASLYLDAYYQPDNWVTAQDILNLPALIDAENARTPGLNLHYCRSREHLVSHLCNIARDTDRDTPYRGRVVLLVDDAWLHHAVADISHQPGQAVSMIALDSNMVSADFAESIETAMQVAGVPCRCFADGAVVQKSTNDCVIFSLSFALKMHDHQAYFDRFHAQLLADPTFQWNARRDALPAGFYKHSHSRVTLKVATENNPPLENAIVNKRGETLVQRQARFIGEFSAGSFRGVKSYSNSIEHKRISFIDRALSHFEGADTKPDQARASDDVEALQRKLRAACLRSF